MILPWAGWKVLVLLVTILLHCPEAHNGTRASRQQMGFPHERKEGRKDALSNTDPEPKTAQRPEGRFQSVLATDVGAPEPPPPPAVLTVVFTQIPVHGADVQPRSSLTSPWAPLAAGI